MGNWGSGLLENDSALDAIGDLLDEIERAAVKAPAQALSSKQVGVYAAQLALIARYDPDLFRQRQGDSEWETTAALRGGIKKHRASLLQVAPKATKLLDVLERGGDVEEMRLGPLLGAKHASAYLQKLADHSIDEVEDNLVGSGARLHLLVQIAPYVELPSKTVRHWLRRLRELTDGASDDELESLRPYISACKKLVEASSSDEDDEDEDGEDDEDDDEDEEDE